MKRVLTPSLFITYPPSPFSFKRSFSVLFTFPNTGQNKSRWRLMLTATLLHIKNKVSSPYYKKISNRETAYDIYESLKMTHEGNAQVKETKALALIQKYEAFKMEDDEDIEKMFSRFQTLTAGLRVLDKGYTKADHVKKIIRSLPRRWGPMVTAFKIAKNLNEVSLEELISALRSH